MRISKLTWSSISSAVANVFYLLLAIVSMENVEKWSALSFLNDIPTPALAAMAAFSLWVLCRNWQDADKMRDAKLPPWDQRSLRQMQRDAGRKLFRSLVATVMIMAVVQRLVDNATVRLVTFMALVVAPSYIFKREPTVRHVPDTEMWSTTI